jgi:hypothetical protein
MQQQTKSNRRGFLATAVLSIAAAKFVALNSEDMDSVKTKASTATPIKQRINTSFGPLKQIDAGLLNVGYAEVGPANGSPVILLHGWPTIFTATSMSHHCWQRRVTG